MIQAAILNACAFFFTHQHAKPELFYRILAVAREGFPVMFVHTESWLDQRGGQDFH